MFGKLRKFCLIAMLLLSNVPAFAWGPAGHAIIAKIAQAHLAPNTARRVKQILAIEPGATMASVSSWADEVKTPQTGPWHYVGLSRGHCHYVPARDCRRGQCLPAAFRHWESVLTDPASTPEQREVALKYIIHLAGDSSQPFHAIGWDKGANTYQVFFDRHGTNLHRLA
jgi:nuclease S1